MYVFCGVYGGMVSIIPFVMVWYGMVCCVSKHKREENVGTFGSGLSVLEPFECASSAIMSYGRFWQARDAGQHNPICMYGM